MDTSPFITGALLPTEINALLSLQEENLIQRLAPGAAEKEGFLTFRYTPLIIKRMMNDLPQPVVRANGELVGYALATSRASAEDIALMKPLEVLCRELRYQNQPLPALRYYFMGQVCVKAGWRGKGAFDALYAHHHALFSDKFDCVVTEIAVGNQRSMAAHQRIGFTPLHSYLGDDNIQWNVVLWDWRK